MCEECHGKRLQRKLTIGASNDPLEAEADRIADQVLAAPAHSAVSKSPPRIQRYTGQATGSAGTAPDSVDRVLSSSGRPLEPTLRQDMEQRFGYDFSQVRVHADAAAEQSARDVNANAYTVGHDIVFGASRFAPGTHDGRRLIAHELTHVVQQSGADGMNVGQSSDGRGLSPMASHLQRAPNPDSFVNLTIGQLRKLVNQGDKAALEALWNRFHAMSNTELARYAVSDPLAQTEYAKRIVTSPAARGQGRFSNPGMLDSLEKDIQAERARLRQTQGITRRSPSAVDPNVEPEGGTIGSARSDIPGLDKGPIIGRSPRAGGQVNPTSNFPPATDPEILPHTQGHAEQNISDQLETMLKKIPEEQLKGRKVYVLIEQAPCSTCAQGAKSAATEAGVLVKLSRAFPKVTFEIKSLDNGALLVLKNGMAPEVASAAATIGGAPQNTVPAPTPKTDALPETKPSARPSPSRPVTSATSLSVSSAEKLPLVVSPKETTKGVTGATEGKTAGTDPSGGGPGGARRVAETKPTVSEGPSAPVSDIVTPWHGQRNNATRNAMQRNNATGKAMEGAWSLILAGQLSYVRGAELKKALDALAALEPRIEQLRQKGIDVTVTVIAEIPDRPDVAALVTGVGDPSQVVRFRDMFISHLSLPTSAAISTVSTMYDAGGDSRDYVGLGDMTLDQQIRFQFGDKYPVPGTGPRTGSHFAEGKQVLPGYAQPKAAEPASPMATRTKGLTGTWRPEILYISVGDLSQMMPLVGRALKVDVDASGAATPRMTLGSRAYAFVNTGPDTTRVMTGSFKMGEGYPPQAQWYWSRFTYYPEKGLILEWADGYDMGHDKLWQALFRWRRL